MEHPQDQVKPPYSLAEYNSFEAAHNNPHPTDKVRLLGVFVANYPKSFLLPYAYEEYFQLYFAERDYPKTIEYVNKLLALGDRVEQSARLQALATRGMAYLRVCGDSAFQTSRSLCERKGCRRRRFASARPMGEATGHERGTVWRSKEKHRNDI